MPATRRDHARTGGLLALSAYLWWGFIPVFFKQVSEAGPFEIILHRLFWTFVCMLFIVLATGRLRALLVAVRNPRTLALLTVSGASIVTNWLLFVWAVVNGRVHDTSLGYFINPLLMVFLGLVVLRERLRPWQIIALGIAVAGVLVRAGGPGPFPWVALALPASFGAYGLIRKQLAVDAFVGLLVETLVLAPFAVVCFIWLAAHGQSSFGPSQPARSAWLMLAGPVTAAPLVLFAAGARRIKMVTLGFLQYLTPTLSFLVAVLIYKETFGPAKLATFVLVWVALALYSTDLVRSSRRPAQVSVPGEV